MGCCAGSSGKAVYKFDKKTKTISKKNVTTLERYSLGAAARNYTKNMKIDFIREIASKYSITISIINLIFY